MTLLKNDGTIKSNRINIVAWPDRNENGIGISFKDGWVFGIGFGLALIVAIPFFLLLFGFVIGIIIATLGGLGALL